MDQIAAELFPPSQIPYPIIFARILGALFLGAVIGFERETKARPAGLKTHMLVCLAACTFGVISLESVRLGRDRARPCGDQSSLLLAHNAVEHTKICDRAYEHGGVVVASKAQRRRIS